MFRINKSLAFCRVEYLIVIVFTVGVIWLIGNYLRYKVQIEAVIWWFSNHVGRYIVLPLLASLKRMYKIHKTRLEFSATIHLFTLSIVLGVASEMTMWIKSWSWRVVGLFKVVKCYIFITTTVINAIIFTKCTCWTTYGRKSFSLGPFYHVHVLTIQTRKFFENLKRTLIERGRILSTTWWLFQNVNCF